MAFFRDPGEMFLGCLGTAEQRFLVTLIQTAAKSGYTRFVEPCAGTFAMANLAVRNGFKPEQIETSDVSMMTSVLGYAITDQSLAPLEIHAQGFSDEELLDPATALYAPRIKAAIRNEQESSKRNDSLFDLQRAIADTFQEMRDRLQERIDAFDLLAHLRKVGENGKKLSTKQWKRLVKRTLGVDLLDDYYSGAFFSTELEQWVNDGVSLIKTIPQDSLDAMENIVMDGFVDGKSLTDIQRDIQAQYGIDKRHAAFIARDQTAKLNAAITERQQKDAGVRRYKWSTSGDERVRSDHKKLDGRVFSYDDPPVVDSRTGRRCNPGQDYNCRCVAIPVFDIDELNLPLGRGDES